MDIPIFFAFTAGMVAAFNPCGAAMFPAYVGYQFGSTHSTSKRGAISTLGLVLQGVGLGTTVTFGFIAVFGGVGMILALGGRFIAPVLPVVGLMVGISITTAGFWLLISKKTLTFTIFAGTRLGGLDGGDRTFLFGIGYALASLSCALPVFLAAVGIVFGAGLSSGGVLKVLFGSLVYSLGMGCVMTCVTIAALFFERSITALLAGVLPWMERVGNFVMVMAGLYIVYYWLAGAGKDVLIFRVQQFLA